MRKIQKEPGNEGVALPEALMAEFIQRPDAAAFKQIVSRYSGPALAVAAQILTDNTLAEDAVQEAFLRVVRFRGRYNKSQPFSSWFYAILRNVCVDMLRQRQRHIKAVEKIADWFTPEKPDQSGIFDAARLLETLPAGEQAILKLRIIHEMPFCDIAAATGISAEAAKKRAQRGLKRLREKISTPEGKIQTRMDSASSPQVYTD